MYVQPKRNKNSKNRKGHTQEILDWNAEAHFYLSNWLFFLGKQLNYHRSKMLENAFCSTEKSSVKVPLVGINVGAPKVKRIFTKGEKNVWRRPLAYFAQIIAASGWSLPLFFVRSQCDAPKMASRAWSGIVQRSNKSTKDVNDDNNRLPCSTVSEPSICFR